MKNYICLILILLLIFCFSNCTPIPREKQVTVPTNTPKRFYREPEIGMPYDDFKKLCLSPVLYKSSKDNSDMYESARGTILTQRLGYTESRGTNFCWGTFTFVDWELDSIFRD